MNDNESWLNDLQEQVDDAHHTTDRADLPPAGLWSSIRAQVQPTEEPKERQTMISTATMPQTLAIPVRSRTVQQEGGFRHYASLVATVALVLAVAVGGWLAMSQMPGGDGNGRFAAMASPEVADATCDVEPMTVNEVMEIVKNPYATMDIRPGDSTTMPPTAGNELSEPLDMRFDLRLLDQEGFMPEQASFDAASAKMDSYLGCVQVGTAAQIFRFLLPTEVQRIVLSAHPVFRDEAQVRTTVEDILKVPGRNIAAPFNDAINDPNLKYASNPDRSSAKAFSRTDARMYDSEEMIVFGIRVTDSNGEVVYQNNAEGASDPVGTLKTTDRMRVVMLKSIVDGEWYVYAEVPE